METLTYLVVEWLTGDDSLTLAEIRAQCDEAQGVNSGAWGQVCETALQELVRIGERP